MQKNILYPPAYPIFFSDRYRKQTKKNSKTIFHPFRPVGIKATRLFWWYFSNKNNFQKIILWYDVNDNDNDIDNILEIMIMIIKVIIIIIIIIIVMMIMIKIEIMIIIIRYSVLSAYNFQKHFVTYDLNILLLLQPYVVIVRGEVAVPTMAAHHMVVRSQPPDKSSKSASCRKTVSRTMWSQYKTLQLPYTFQKYQKRRRRKRLKRLSSNPRSKFTLNRLTLRFQNLWWRLWRSSRCYRRKNMNRVVVKGSSSTVIRTFLDRYCISPTIVCIR